MPPSADQLLAQLAELLNTRMRLHELRRSADYRHLESQKCSDELNAMLRRFHEAHDPRSLSVSDDGLAD